MVFALLALLAGPPALAADAPKKPRVAIVIDDFGLNYKTTPPDEEWMRIAWPMTYAVMPDSPRTRKVAEATKRAGKELMIHFPFDPFQKLELPEGSASREDVEKVGKLLIKAFDQIPGPAGINNHQSYRSTMNRALMTEFMKLISSRNVYFLDSKVSDRSVAYDEAKRAGLKAARNYVFLEDKGHFDDKAFARKMLRRAAARARKKGHAIAIGHHYYRGTLEGILEEVPALQKEGIEFVFASELAD